ncbi:hypothetical protein L9F63_003911, partial [Diploptera punctata]
MELFHLVLPYPSIWIVILILVFCSFAVFNFWMFYGFSKERRKLTQLARKLHGPTPLPIIGNAARFIGAAD